MRSCLIISLFILLCIGMATAAYPCTSDPCTAPECTSIDAGIIMFSTQDTAVTPQFSIDGAPVSLNQFFTYWGAVQMPGTHTFSISAPGYLSTSGSAEVCTDKVTYVSFTLIKSPSMSKLGFGSTVSPITFTTPPTGSGSGGTKFIGGNVGGVTLPATTMQVPADGTTTVVAGVTTPAVQQGVPQGTQQGSVPAVHQTGTSPAGTAQAGSQTGSLSVTTSPTGASIFIDGVQRAVSPAIVPGLAPGDHMLILRLDGYQNFTAPITIEAGKTQEYSSALVKSAAPADAATPMPAPKKSPAPGIETVGLLAGLGAVLCMLKIRAG